MAIFHEDIIHKVRKHSMEMESSRELAPEILELIYENKWFKLFVPEELGGLMLELPQALRIFERASWIDGSFGWLITIGSGGGFFSATLPALQAKRLFSARQAVIAGSGQPSGTAFPVDGGYQVSGQWKYCSGSAYASFFTANCIIQHEGEPEIRSFAFLPEQAEVIEDWNAFGLKATESHSIKVDNAFVPEDMTFSIASEPNYNDPIFQYPFLQFAQTSFAAVSIGICRHFMQEAAVSARSQKEKWESKSAYRFATVLSRIEEKEAAFDKAVNEFYEIVDASWAEFVKHRLLSAQDQAEVSRVSQEAARIALDCSHTVFPLLGMTALMEDSALNRIWRDLHTAAQHTVLVPIEA